jgi:hypothetical protein
VAGLGGALGMVIKGVVMMAFLAFSGVWVFEGCVLGWVYGFDS